MSLHPFITAALALLLSIAPAAAKDAQPWLPWSADIFERAKAENRFVILDLEAVWCHWCHVMEETTYRDPKVVELLEARYLTVRVDQDANPDISNRYGDWGWPATIVFAPDGTEIVKRRGYIPPAAMASLLAAIIEDPSPGPSIIAEAEVIPAGTPLLTPERRADLRERSRKFFDKEHAGWGEIHKYIDTDSMDWELALFEKGDAEAGTRARRTFDAALNLIDRVDGGIYQYSDQLDWKSPHYEKIMWYQASSLRQYSQAYGLWREARYLEAARDLKRYLVDTLLGPDGAFFTSQDADVDLSLPGKDYYALDRAARDSLGRAPRIDTNIYARENGWAITGLTAYYAATGDEDALKAAERSARWIVENRRIDGGGFKHGEKDRSGPYLGDTLAMGQAALDLYAATGRREWLEIAKRAGEFIAARFKDDTGGFKTSARTEADVGALARTTKPLEEQTQVTRFANRLHRYLGSAAFKELAEHGARYLNADAVLNLPRALPGILLVDAELGEEPTHITIVGRRDNPLSGALHAAGRAYPAGYKRLDWWDKREGPLPNPDVLYPELEQPAAFACTNRICSHPVHEPSELADTVTRMLALRGATE